jgi:DNA repair exonuclease SbcCD ATPase subunit
MAELSRQQEDLSRQQEPLSRQQGELGREQGELGREQQRLSEMAAVDMRKLADDAIAEGLAERVPD